MRVAVIYHILPHYRKAVFQELDNSIHIDFTFVSSGNSYRGIEHLDTELLKRFKKAPFRSYGSLMWQTGAIRMALSRPRFDALVFLSDIHFVSTWIAAIIARFRGIPVLFWGHGWLRRESEAKSFIRRAFYRLANHLLVYGERAGRIGAKAGYPKKRISVVYNSLDFVTALTLIKKIESMELSSLNPKNLFQNKGEPLIVCTARLTKNCQFELLFEAASMLRKENIRLNILLVGDGPEKQSLEAKAAKLELPVIFFGQCHDEDVVSQVLYYADLTVSPGKVGLTAIHSLMYGTPVVTHGDLDEQMPEAEAIENGVTGFLFDRADAASLARQISRGISGNRSREDTRLACQAVIQAKWNPKVQANLIENAIVTAIVTHG